MRTNIDGVIVESLTEESSADYVIRTDRFRFPFDYTYPMDDEQIALYRRHGKFVGSVENVPEEIERTLLDHT